MSEKKQGVTQVAQSCGSDKEQADTEHNELKREFMKKFGVYAAGAPLGLYAALKPDKTLAASDGGP